MGFICSCTGAGGYGAFLADAEHVYLAWAESVNALGGINGHQVKVITEDDTGTPGTSGSEAQTLISDHVDAIVDGSLDDSVWENAVKAANIPVVGSNETSQPFGANSDFYPEGDTNDASLIGVAHVWKEAGVKKLADLYCGGVITCLQDIPIFEKAGQQLGAPVVYKAAIYPTAPNYDAECLHRAVGCKRCTCRPGGAHQHSRRHRL